MIFRYLFCQRKFEDTDHDIFEHTEKCFQDTQANENINKDDPVLENESEHVESGAANDTTKQN